MRKELDICIKHGRKWDELRYATIAEFGKNLTEMKMPDYGGRRAFSVEMRVGKIKIIRKFQASDASIPAHSLVEKSAILKDDAPLTALSAPKTHEKIRSLGLIAGNRIRIAIRIVACGAVGIDRPEQQQTGDMRRCHRGAAEGGGPSACLG